MHGARGFVTIATGEYRYYEIAENLLLSYRMHTSNPCPFAIIADRENDITSKFDDVIIIDKPSGSYNDKLRLFEYLPYEETIFIDADCLAYGDLNEWWDMFSAAGDFSCFGYAIKDLKTDKGWFIAEGMGEYSKMIHFVPTFNGGVYYMRKTDTCKKVFEIANNCIKDYKKYKFSVFSGPADEPLLALGMAVCNCEPVNADVMFFAPKAKYLDADITIPRAKYTGNNGKSKYAQLIHWSNYLTQKAYYKLEVFKMKTVGKRDNTESARKAESCKYKLKYWLYHVYDVKAFAGRVFRKIKKMLKRK